VNDGVAELSAKYLCLQLLATPDAFGVPREFRASPERVEDLEKQLSPRARGSTRIRPG
jgi:hypothetical protein